MLHMRPHNRFEDLDSVYLVGGGTHPGSGLPVIYSSARITSDLLLEDLGIAAPSDAPRRDPPTDRSRPNPRHQRPETARTVAGSQS
jgi:phytoene desaturase